MPGMRIVPTRIHGVLDYGVGVLMIVAPWLFQFSDVGTAKWVSIVIGVVVIATALMTNYELGVAHVVPMHVHLVLDAAVGIITAISPWIFGFADEGTNAWLPFLVIGLGELGATAISSPWPERAELVRREEKTFRHTASA
jgi:SPW repeat